MIDSIAPGETVTQRVQVFFADAGQHVIEANLPEDAVRGDNRRWCVVSTSLVTWQLTNCGRIECRYYI